MMGGPAYAGKIRRSVHCLNFMRVRRRWVARGRRLSKVRKKGQSFGYSNGEEGSSTSWIREGGGGSPGKSLVN